MPRRRDCEYFDMPVNLWHSNIVMWLTRATLLVYEPRKLKGALFFQARL